MERSKSSFAVGAASKARARHGTIMISATPTAPYAHRTATIVGMILSSRRSSILAVLRRISSLDGLEQSAELSYRRGTAYCLQRRPECHLVGCEHGSPQLFLQGLDDANGA